MKRLLRDQQWQILALLWGCGMLMSVAGFAQYAALHNLPNTFLDNLYLTLQLIPMNSGAVAPPLPWMLEIARFAIPLLTAAAAVKALLAIFSRQIQMLRLRNLREHVIICGLGRNGFLLAGKLRSLGKAVVIIERNEKNDWLVSCQEQGMFILLGDASDPALLRKAGIQRASAMIVVCGNDGVNADIALHTKDLAQPGKHLTCLVHISSPQLCNLLQEQGQTLDDHGFHLELFNIFERGAQRLLSEFPAWQEDQSQEVPHLLVVGLGRLGENLVLHAARGWWNQSNEPRKKLPITIIDRDAQRKIESLILRYPPVQKTCSFFTLDMEIFSPEFERADFLHGDDQRTPPVSTVYICLDDDSRALQISLTLLRQTHGSVPIVMRMAENHGLASLLNHNPITENAYQSLHAFGLLDSVCTPDLLTNTRRDLLAQAAHEEYMRTQPKTGTPAANPAMQPWKSLDVKYRQANYDYVDHIQRLLEASGYSIAPLSDWDAPSRRFPDEIIEHMAKMEHDFWMKDRLGQGWRYAHGAKNLEARTNPTLVDWNILSEDEREKDRVLVKGIPAFLGRVGLQIKKA
ncbi:MAG: NAD(P)-binding protein [Chloroflexota bacterium]